MVFGQLYYTISGEELFVFCNKKSRIYAACGVLQTPNLHDNVVPVLSINVPASAMSCIAIPITYIPSFEALAAGKTSITSISETLPDNTSPPIYDLYRNINEKVIRGMHNEKDIY